LAQELLFIGVREESTTFGSEGGLLMRTFRIATAATLLTFGLALVLQQGFEAAAQAKGKVYNLVLTTVKVKPTTADGKSWDPNDGLPDIVVRMKNLDDPSAKKFVSEEMKDTLSAKFDRVTMFVREGQKVQIEVVDIDPVGEDLIGRTTLDITKEMISKGAADIGFGQVESLKLEFRNP
jgi:hypothetical protein